MENKTDKYEKFELPPTAEEFDEITDEPDEDVIEEKESTEDTNMSEEQEASLPPVDDTPTPKPQQTVQAKVVNGNLVAVDEPIDDSPSELPLIEETNDNSQEEIVQVDVEEVDKIKFGYLTLEMKNMELESQVLEQKYQRKADEAKIFVKDLKAKYNVPDDWKYNPNTGCLIKP